MRGNAGKDPPDKDVPVNCRELFERLSEFVDGELSQEICEEIRKHMEGCDPCVNFAKTLKTTADLCRRMPSQPIPPAVALELQVLLSKHLRQSNLSR
jgi:anti-sigma factor (TIGR02949 family)